MYERFTDRSRKVMQLANQEAQRFNHEYVGTEHILLGLIKEGSGVAANVLKNLDLNLNRLRAEIEKIVQAGPDMVTMGKMPMTPRAKKVLEYAIEEARTLEHNYVGTEHLLLGLLREKEGIAVQALTNLGITLEETREEILNLLGKADPTKPAPSPTLEGVPWNVEVALSGNDKVADLMVLTQLEAIVKNKGSTPARKILEDMQQVLNDYLRDPGPDLRDEPPDLSEA